jgi:hypothetical protein
LKWGAGGNEPTVVAIVDDIKVELKELKEIKENHRLSLPRSRFSAYASYIGEAPPTLLSHFLLELEVSLEIVVG